MNFPKHPLLAYRDNTGVIVEEMWALYHDGDVDIGEVEYYEDKLQEDDFYYHRELGIEFLLNERYPLSYLW